MRCRRRQSASTICQNCLPDSSLLDRLVIRFPVLGSRFRVPGARCSVLGSLGVLCSAARPLNETSNREPRTGNGEPGLEARPDVCVYWPVESRSRSASSPRAMMAAQPVTPRAEHPRPDFMRADWRSLNGLWQFEFDDQNRGLAERWFRRDQSLTQADHRSVRLSNEAERHRRSHVPRRRVVSPDHRRAGRVAGKANPPEFRRRGLRGHRVGQRRAGGDCIAGDTRRSAPTSRTGSNRRATSSRYR